MKYNKLYGPIREGSFFVQEGTFIPAKKTQIHSFNNLEVIAGTTGYRGGDSGHGGRSIVMIQDKGNTDMRVEATRDRFGCQGVKIVLGGDSELWTMIQALRFAADTLEKMSAPSENVVCS